MGCGGVVGGLWVVVFEVGRLWNVLADISHHSKTEERICGDLFTPLILCQTEKARSICCLA